MCHARKRSETETGYETTRTVTHPVQKRQVLYCGVIVPRGDVRFGVVVIHVPLVCNSLHGIPITGRPSGRQLLQSQRHTRGRQTRHQVSFKGEGTPSLRKLRDTHHLAAWTHYACTVHPGTMGTLVAKVCATHAIANAWVSAYERVCVKLAHMECTRFP
jgi:hypothetical protein